MRKLAVLLIFFLGLFAPFFLVKATTLEDKQKQIDELEKKVEELKSQANTLAGQIAYYDNQISLNQLKISQTEDLIALISQKIDLLERKLQVRAHLLERQIVVTYKQGKLDPFQLIFSSNDFSHMVSRFKYAQQVQNNNRRLLYDTQVLQSNYAQQKDLIEESQKKLRVQKESLSALRAEKDNLLKQTKNSEAIYQEQLEQARLELAAIQNALATAISEGPVKKGDPIALVGNTGYPGCSTGKHLHFEVRLNDMWVNAETYLKNITDKWGLNIGSGSWDWPISGTVQITQRYGKTPYSYRYLYSGGIHTGIDMISDNDVIRAVADGNLYSSIQNCGGSALKIKYIDHGNSLMTFYLHVQ
jgi:peptidoglycan hydrolase CwlO-like protein